MESGNPASESLVMYTLVETREYLQNGENIIEMDDDAGIDMYVDQENLIVCNICCRKYKTKGGYNRHMRNKHGDNNNQSPDAIDDVGITETLQTALSELGLDNCYPPEIRKKWEQYTIYPNPDLYYRVKSIYTILTETSNAENFYEQFYSQLLFLPSYFPGLDYGLSVELLRKSADKLLARYQLKIKSGSSNNAIPAIITATETDALEYLGGYILRNTQNKFATKNNQVAIEIIDCFKSDNNNDQPLICILDRGGLTGITPYTKRMLLKAENVFRDFTARHQPQNIHIGAMVDALMADIEVKSCYTISTQILTDINEELLLNVVEGIFSLYLRVRSFSYVKDLRAEKKKEKAIASKDKALRKELKTHYAN